MPRHLDNLLDPTLHFNLSLHINVSIQRDFIGNHNNCYFLLYLDQHQDKLCILQLETTQYLLYYLGRLLLLR